LYGTDFDVTHAKHKFLSVYRSFRPLNPADLHTGSHCGSIKKLPVLRELLREWHILLLRAAASRFAVNPSTPLIGRILHGGICRLIDDRDRGSGGISVKHDFDHRHEDDATYLNYPANIQLITPTAPWYDNTSLTSGNNASGVFRADTDELVGVKIIRVSDTPLANGLDTTQFQTGPNTFVTITGY
jgi:hypothetical protein